jgi:hypothetical protein
MSDNAPFSMTIHAIQRDLERSPDGRGGEVHYQPSTAGIGGSGCFGDYLLKEWQELADALTAVTAERDQARKLLADAPHTKGCFEDSFDYGDGCRCWKAEL